MKIKEDAPPAYVKALKELIPILNANSKRSGIIEVQFGSECRSPSIRLTKYIFREVFDGCDKVCLHGLGTSMYEISSSVDGITVFALTEDLTDTETEFYRKELGLCQ
jgi:hypothetical protein